MQSQKLGIFSAIVASICCVAPLLLVLVGLGSLGLGSFLGKYHWVFIGLGIVVLTAAWAFYFKEKRRCEAEQCQMKNKKVSQLTLMVASLAVLFFLGANLYTYAGGLFGSHGQIEAEATTDREQVIIPVEGMTCFTCEITVEHAAKSVDGVFKADADVTKKSVTVEYDPNKATVSEIVEAVNKTGYQAQVPQTSN